MTKDETVDYLSCRALVPIPDNIKKKYDIPIKQVKTIEKKSVSDSKIVIQNAFGGKMVFDITRYKLESKDEIYIEAENAYQKEKFEEALFLYHKAYVFANMLAGVKLGLMYYCGDGIDKDYEKAIPFFIEGMKNGIPLATDWLGEAYRMGRGVPKDEQKAQKIFVDCEDALLEMCIYGDKDAQYAYGWRLLYGHGREANETQAFYWLKKSADAGHIAAKVQLAKCYQNGWGCEMNLQQAVTIAELCAKTRNDAAHYLLGEMYLYGNGVEKDYQKALSLLLYAAERGRAGAQRYVGDIYYYGNAVKVDYVEARKWYLKSAEKGNAVAYSQLANIYYFGKGIEKDEDKAFKYYKLSADKGDKYDQYLIHNFYFWNSKFKNYELGRQYLEKSAKQGYVEAQKLLARMYISGFGFDSDEKFVYWMRKAAEQGDAEAEMIFGKAYYCFGNEEVLPKSYPDALIWLNKASQQGNIEAKLALMELYFDGEGVSKDLAKVDELMQEVEYQFSIQETNENNMSREHGYTADLYYSLFSDKEKRQLTFQHYCKALNGGERGILYNFGWMYFVNGYRDACLKVSTEEILNMIKSEEEKSEEGKLAHLLGEIYFEGYQVKVNKKEAENWCLKAKEKGFVFSYVKLAYYYINDLHMNEKGFQLAEQAYQKQSVAAARLLGICYKSGIGVKKNRKKAKELLKEAAAKGDQYAVAELKKFIF